MRIEMISRGLRWHAICAAVLFEQLIYGQLGAAFIDLHEIVEKAQSLSHEFVRLLVGFRRLHIVPSCFASSPDRKAAAVEYAECKVCDAANDDWYASLAFVGGKYFASSVLPQIWRHSCGYTSVWLTLGDQCTSQSDRIIRCRREQTANFACKVSHFDITDVKLRPLILVFQRRFFAPEDFQLWHVRI